MCFGPVYRSVRKKELPNICVSKLFPFPRVGPAVPCVYLPPVGEAIGLWAINPYELGPSGILVGFP